jgi:group II intron reverse transcriptase/maturase
VSLETPDKIRSLQQRLYAKAKAEPAFRFYLLYDKVYREDILLHAYRLAHSKRGAPGADGKSFRDIEALGVEKWLAALGKDLREETYKPSPVRRVMIPKPGGGERPLGIPTIRDRVAQTAAKLVLEPIFEADFADSAYGYRPGRSAGMAIEKTHRALCEGYTDVVDADLSKYFDSIPHDQLMKSVARRVSDARLLRLIKAWLKTPVEETDERGNRRMTGGKGSRTGTPQGGVISPLLANIYMNRFLRVFLERGKDREFAARLVSYADDFVILSRGRAEAALAWTRRVMAAIGLSLNETKTCIRDARPRGPSPPRSRTAATSTATGRPMCSSTRPSGASPASHSRTARASGRSLNGEASLGGGAPTGPLRRAAASTPSTSRRGTSTPTAEPTSSAGTRRAARRSSLCPPGAASPTVSGTPSAATRVTVSTTASSTSTATAETTGRALT